MKYLTNYVPQEKGGMSAGYVVVEDNGVLKAQKLSFDGTTPQFDGVAEEITDVGIFETGLDEPAYNGGGTGGTAKYYKCVSVDTANKTWSGYELVYNEAGYYELSDVITENLTYSGFIPAVDGIYSADCTIEVSNFYQGFLLVSPTNMASNETNEWLITRSSVIGGKESFYAFNEAYTTQGWQSDHYTSPPQWIQWQSKLKKIKVTSYSIQASNEDPANMTPRNWELQGSNNGSDWVIVDERTDGITNATALGTYTFECQNPGSYSYYRLYMKEPAPIGYLIVGQIRAYGQFEYGENNEMPPELVGTPKGYRLMLRHLDLDPVWEEEFVQDDIDATGTARTWTNVNPQGFDRIMYNSDYGGWNVFSNYGDPLYAGADREDPWGTDGFDGLAEIVVIE